MRAFLLFLLFVSILFLYVKYIEHKGVYYPSKDVIYSPDALPLDYEDIYFLTSDNVRLNGWFIPNQQATLTLLFCHGNAGNIGHRLEKIALLHRLGVNVFIFDYRGFGNSQGSISEAGFYRDAQGAYDYLTTARKIRPQRIILYGESLGSAMVVDLAAKKPVKAIVLEGAFSRGRDIAKVIFPYIPAFLFSNKFDSLSKIRNVSCPLVSFHTPQDEVVPLSLGRKLFEAAAGPKTFVELRGTHNDAYLVSETEYISRLQDFIVSLK